MNVKVTNFSTSSFIGQDEQILCALIVGPDKDAAVRRVLHLRTDARFIEALQHETIEARMSFMSKVMQLLEEFCQLVLR